jgi:hypothetical protein
MQHQREETQCIIRASEITDGKITLEQAMNLRSTKKKASDMTDEERWFEWFGILLPTHPMPLSPCKFYPRNVSPLEKVTVAHALTNLDYEDTTSSTLNTLSTQSSTGIFEYKEYLRIPLDDKKQHALEAELGGALGITNPDMCKILASKFRAYQLRDLQRFDEDKLKPTYGISSSGGLAAVEKASDHIDKAEVDVPADFDSFFMDCLGGDLEDAWAPKLE